jgi:hypothetical protein
VSSDKFRIHLERQKEFKAEEAANWAVAEKLLTLISRRAHDGPVTIWPEELEAAGVFYELDEYDQPNDNIDNLLPLHRVIARIFSERIKAAAASSAASDLLSRANHQPAAEAFRPGVEDS